MQSKLIQRQRCLEKRDKIFKTRGNDCLKTKDVRLIISEIKSKLKISSIGIYYPIKSEISPLKVIIISFDNEIIGCDALSLKSIIDNLV